MGQGVKVSQEQLTFLSHYSDDTTQRERLYPLFKKVFGMDSDVLKDFYKRGLWTNSYNPYTFFHKEKAVANVSMFPLTMRINQTEKKCIGIQSVMTDPDFRKQGLMKQLFSKMLDEIDKTYEGAFFFTDSPDLYTRYGFRVIEQHYFRLPFKQRPFNSPSSLKKVDPFHSLNMEWIKKLLLRKVPLSNEFAPISYEHPFYFNLYNTAITSKLFLIEALHTLIVFDILGDTLRIFDCISLKPLSLELLCSHIPFKFDFIEFYFNPDVFSLKDKDVSLLLLETENKLMSRGPFQLDNQFLMMPITAVF